MSTPFTRLPSVTVSFVSERVIEANRIEQNRKCSAVPYQNAEDVATQHSGAVAFERRPDAQLRVAAAAQHHFAARKEPAAQHIAHMTYKLTLRHTPKHRMMNE
jgi:hypothetical protein